MRGGGGSLPLTMRGGVASAKRSLTLPTHNSTPVHSPLVVVACALTEHTFHFCFSGYHVSAGFGGGGEERAHRFPSNWTQFLPFPPFRPPWARPPSGRLSTSSGGAGLWRPRISSHPGPTPNQPPPLLPPPWVL